MNFFDANCYIGLSPSPTTTQRVQYERFSAGGVRSLLMEMKKAGIQKALVWHIAQLEASSQLGNLMLSEAIREHENLYGCWSVLPESTGENPAELFHMMEKSRIAALKVSPKSHLFVACRYSLGKLLDELSERYIPLLVSVKRDMGWKELYELLSDYPELTVIIAEHGCWGEDRYFRPLLENFPNTYLEISNYLLDGGIEDLVARYGSSRILYGSGFPELYHGGMMLALKHADITEEDKEAIAAVNLEKMIVRIYHDQ